MGNRRRALMTAWRGLCLVLACSLALPSLAWSADHHRSGWVQRMPRGHQVIVQGRNSYYYHGGVFYQRHPRGYFVVPPPRRAVVAALPLGFAALVLGGITYYTYAGVYYQRAPGGYVVVEPPVGVVAASPPPATEPYPAMGSVVVTAPALNVRSGPGYNYSVLTVVNQCVTLVVRGASSGWLNVQLPDGQLGWVLQGFTAPYMPSASTPSG